MLVEISAFVGSLRWPSEPRDLGVGGVSQLEPLFLYELGAGERLTCEKAFVGSWRVGVQFRWRGFPPIYGNIVGFGVMFRVLCGIYVEYDSC